MKKRDKIIYWIATIWLSLGMVSTGIVQFMRMDDEVALIVNGLGYPMYLLTLLGIWKLLGVVAVLIPKYPLVKEWAYAGFFFTMTGAIYSHIVAGGTMNEIFPPVLLLVLTGVSYYFRPVDRKINSVNV
jgi:uncharacterized membrane protein YphA (DoxX/SURF4 family)